MNTASIVEETEVQTGRPSFVGMQPVHSHRALRVEGLALG